MDWFMNDLLICLTVLLFAGMGLATILACLISEKALDAPENFAKVLAAIREQVRWFQPGPRE